MRMLVVFACLAAVATARPSQPSDAEIVRTGLRIIPTLNGIARNGGDPVNNVKYLGNAVNSILSQTVHSADRAELARRQAYSNQVMDSLVSFLQNFPGRDDPRLAAAAQGGRIPVGSSPTIVVPEVVVGDTVLAL